MTMMQHRQVRYIGLDVHRGSVAAAIAEDGGAPRSYGNIANDPPAIRTLMTRLGGPDVQLRVAYEAGLTGYALHRQLSSMSIECIVVAFADPEATWRQGQEPSARCAQAGSPAAEWRSPEPWKSGGRTDGRSTPPSRRRISRTPRTQTTSEDPSSIPESLESTQRRCVCLWRSRAHRRARVGGPGRARSGGSARTVRSSPARRSADSGW
jgi:hypothetical protein